MAVCYAVSIPVVPTLSGYPEQALTLLGPNLVLFLLLFSLVMVATTAFNILSCGSDKSRVLFLGAFAVIFGSFWIFSQSGRLGETYNYASDAQFALQTGHLPFPLFYQGEPGSGTLVLVVSRVIGLGIFQTIVVLSILTSVAFILCTFVLFKSFGLNGRMATTAVMFLVLADISVGGRFGIFSAQIFTDFVLFPLAILCLRVGKFGSSIALLLLMADMVITHFLTIAIVAALLTFMFAAQLIRRTRWEGFRITPAVTLIPIVLIVVWQLIGNGTNFGLFIGLYDILSTLSVPNLIFPTTTTALATSSLSPVRIPIWATATLAAELFLMAVVLIVTLGEIVRR